MNSVNLDITNLSMDSTDSDTCDINEINELFSPCRHVHSQSLGPKYTMTISATNETNPHVAAALSDNSCDIFSLNQGQVAKVTRFTEHSDKIVDCKFSSDNNNLLYTGSNDGTVKLWDLRESKGSVITFTDSTVDNSGPVKPISSFDMSPCNRLLAAGTNLTEGDAFILFWDIRNRKLMGAYWESHTDDITQVKFNPDDSNKLMSGSTDGLINIYDLKETSEDDALQECLNTESLVESLTWFYENNQWKISCITSTIDLQLWEHDGAEPYKHFRREDVARQIRKSTDNAYLVNAHQVKNSLLVLAGSNKSEGKSLRSIQILNGSMLPALQFVENTQRVRASFINENTNILITGGEKGKLDIWQPDFSMLNFKGKRK